MKAIGQLCLQVTLVTSSCAALALLAHRKRATRALLHATNACGIVALLSLTGAVGILAWALVDRDCGFENVAQYSSRSLPWRYSLSGSWVGQNGSLLLWAWALAGLSAFFRLWRTSHADLRDCAFGVLMTNLAVITAVLLFAADPFQSGLAPMNEAARSSPLLQRLSSFVGVSVIVTAYAAWSLPFALIIAALLLGKLDAAWTQFARPWAVFAWSLLLIGLLLGANWADPGNAVEKGALLPWLTGTAFIHGLTAWHAGNCLKKMTLALGFVTFGLCYFATFLTCSDVFTGIRGIDRPPVGSVFLGLSVVVMVGGGTLLFSNRRALRPERAVRGALARENMILVTMMLLVTLALMVLGSILIAPLSDGLVDRTITLNPAGRATVVMTVGFLLLAITAAVPLSRWGDSPERRQRRVIGIGLAVGKIAASLGALAGVRQFASAWATGLATVAFTAFVGAIVLELWQSESRLGFRRTGTSVREICRRFAGYGVHLAVIVLVIGITGSAIGTRRHDVELAEGDVIRADRQKPMVRLQWIGGVMAACCMLAAVASRRRSARAAIHDVPLSDQSETVRRLAA